MSDSVAHSGSSDGSSGPASSAPVRPLVITDEPDLLDDILRLAAAGCVEVEVAPDPAGAGPGWARAPLVVVGQRAAEECVVYGLPRRERVVLVAQSDPGDADAADLWQLATDLGADHVVFLPAAEPWLVDRFADCAAGGGHAGGAPAPVVGVVGGRGGAGASVLAAALAVTAVRRGLRPMLVDGDPLGGGLDLVLGGEEAGGLRWPDLAGTRGRVSPGALSAALPRVGELCVLSWDRGDVLDVPLSAMEAVVASSRRDTDLVVVDLPRRVDAAVSYVVQRADRVLLVVPAEVRACAAAARIAASLAPHTEELQVVVRGPAPGGLKAREIASALGLPLAGTLRPEPGLAAALERGEAPASAGRGPLTAFCGRLLDRLALAGSAAA